jgi:hypothetical protein
VPLSQCTPAECASDKMLRLVIGLDNGDSEWELQWCPSTSKTALSSIWRSSFVCHVTISQRSS